MPGFLKPHYPQLNSRPYRVCEEKLVQRTRSQRCLRWDYSELEPHFRKSRQWPFLIEGTEAEKGSGRRAFVNISGCWASCSRFPGLKYSYGAWSGGLSHGDTIGINPRALQKSKLSARKEEAFLPGDGMSSGSWGWSVSTQVPWGEALVSRHWSALPPRLPLGLRATAILS